MYKEIVSWWETQNVQTAADLQIVLENFRIIFACNSNGIEGNTIGYHTTRDIFEGKTLSGYNGTVREIFEVQNQKFAFDFIAKSFEEHRGVSIDFILKLHAILLYGCYDSSRWEKGERPGSFKKHDYGVGIAETGSFPEDVEMDLAALLDDMAANSDAGNVLLKASYFHLAFETIHPFADGNGRTGRTLLNYYLLLNGYPPVVIFEEDKETYYLALEVFDRTGKIDGFVGFLQEQMEKTWKGRVQKTSLKKLESFL